MALPAVIIPAIVGALTYAVTTLVGRVLLALGIGYVTYTGFNFVLDQVFTLVQSSFQGLPSDISRFLAFMWVDKAVSLIFSAYSAVFAVRSLGSHTFTRMIIK